MNTKSIQFNKFMIRTIIILGVLVSNVSLLEGQSYKLFGVSDMVRVFEDGFKLPRAFDTISLFGIRGEIISGQFVINSKKGLADVTTVISPLINKSTGQALSSDATWCNFVGSIPLTKNTPNQPLSVLSRQAPAKFPDYLMDDKQINIKEKTWQSVWLTVKIPASALPGIYSGKVTVRTGTSEQSLPVNLTIYPLTIPEARHLKIVEWYNTNGFSRFHGIQEEYTPAWFAMLGKYADNMVEHRQNSFMVDMDKIAIQQSKDGTFSFDFTRFDQIARVFWNTGKMDYMETGFLARRGEKGWSDTNFRWKDFNVRKAETGEIVIVPGLEVIPSLVEAFESHLRLNGWLNKTWFHIQDEPAVHNALSWTEFSRLIHYYAPDLIRMDAIETSFLLDDIEIAVPKLDHFAAWNDVYRKWMEKGHELWFYTVGIYQGSLYPNKTIDVPLIDSRILHWMNYLYDATGYLHWGWNQWNENPFTDTGMHIGDGWHVYPAKEGVLNSVRWEEMRNGIQDYEYLWMLEEKIRELKDSLGSRFSWINPKQRGKEIAGQVVQGFAEYTRDPEVVISAKMQVTSELLDFDRSPGLYVQTNPSEGSEITGGSSVEVFGWAEPGTKIKVNGMELPVSEQGLFLEQFKISTDKNSIIVDARGSAGSKVMVRRFKVK